MPGAMKISRTRAGRYYGFGETHSFLIERDGDGWRLTVTRAIVVAGVQITDPDARPDRSHHSYLSSARAVVAEFESLGDDYRAHEHGHRSRLTEAVQRAYAADLTYPARESA